MSTSIITTTTFTFATIIDVQAPVAAGSTPISASAVVTPAPVDENAEDEAEIEACTLAAFPRCEWAKRSHCGRRDVHGAN